MRLYEIKKIVSKYFTNLAGNRPNTVRPASCKSGLRRKASLGTKKNSCSKPMLAVRPLTLKPNKFNNRAPSLDNLSEARNNGVFSSKA